MRVLCRSGWVLLLLTVLAAGCAKKDAENVPLLKAEATYQAAMDLLERGKLISAVEAFQAIDLRFADNRAELEPLVRLGMADANYYQETVISLIDARSMYLEFVTLFGDHPLAPYAQFQAGMCSLKQVNHPSKDQTQTYQAFRDLREVIRRFPSSRYAVAAEDMIGEAEATLAEHEFMVGRFYMKRKLYLAASDRFRLVLDRYPQYDDREKVYFYLGQTLLMDDNAAEGRIYLDKIVSDFPNGKYFEQAKKALSQAGDPLELGLGNASN